MPDRQAGGSPGTESLSDTDLLAIQLSVHWTIDDQRRLHNGLPALVVACAGDETIAAVRSDLADNLAEQLLASIDNGVRPDPGQTPPALYQCQELFDHANAAESIISGGPSYFVRPALQAETSATIVRSDREADRQSVVHLRPGNWQPGEWHELVNGGAGAPWAMVVENDRVVSICHTPARSFAGAEAGTWTDPAYRGRGYAAATTAVWADLLAADCPYLFYCTSSTNRSSQRVAERLGLRHLGWLWKLTEVS